MAAIEGDITTDKRSSVWPRLAEFWTLFFQNPCWQLVRVAYDVRMS